MPTKPASPCPKCRRLAYKNGRCGACGHNRNNATARGYDSRWQRIAAAAVADHVARFGYVCPGWERPPHPADPDRNPLTGHHTDRLADGGDPHQQPAVLCRSCNSAAG